MAASRRLPRTCCHLRQDRLELGASQTLTITFNTEDMASFDSKDKGCYVLEEGDYIISINERFPHGSGFQDLQLASTIVYDESNTRSTDAVAATTKFDFADDKLTYLSVQTASPTTPRRLLLPLTTPCLRKA